jgi:integrase
VTVRRRLTKDKKIKDETKNRKHRTVPLPAVVVAELRRHPRRLDTRLVFPAPRGGYIDLHNWREDFWHPGMVSAGFVTDEGKPDRRPYALRHTYATMALRAGLPTFTVARMMGTGIEMIEDTYGHLAHDASEWVLQRLEALEFSTDGRIVDTASEAE